MATNHYFNHHGTDTPEQRLIEDLTIESIKTFGIDVYYLPRTLNDEDKLMGQDNTASYNTAHTIEMYIKTVEGFEGQGDFISGYGLQINDQITFTVAKRRFKELGMTSDGRADIPHEGDLIYFPITSALFQILFVEDEAIFYQTGKLQSYDMLCEMFTYSDQNFNTGIEEIDKIEREQSYSIEFTLNTGSGNYTIGEQVYQGTSLAAATVKGEVAAWNAADKVLKLINMNGNFSSTSNIIGDDSDASYSITSFDAQTSAANTAATSSTNQEIEAAADAIIDFTEGNPFGSL